MPDDILVLDGVVYLIHQNFEQSEVGFIPVNFGEILSRLIDSSDYST